MFITHCSTSISLNCIFSSSSLLVKIPLAGLFKKKGKKKKNLPHRNERVAPNACAATPFRQSQGHRHALAVCWQPCMNTKARTWKSSPAFQLSSPRHCGENTDYIKKKKKKGEERKCSLVWSKIACIKTTRSDICWWRCISTFTTSLQHLDSLFTTDRELATLNAALSSSQIVWKTKARRTGGEWKKPRSEKARQDKDKQALATFCATPDSFETIPHANDAVHLGELASFVVKH